MSLTLHVFLKEFREMMRDKRVRFSAFAGPFLIVFMLLFLIGTLVRTISKPSSIKLHVVMPKTSNALLDSLKQKNVTIVEVPDLEAGRRLVRDGKAALVLAFDDEDALNLASGQPTAIEAVYDSKESRSQIAMATIERGIAQMNKDSVRRILESKGISPEQANPVRIKSEDVTRAKGASEMLTGFLPYLIVMWAFFGGVSGASDIVAGEKERNTLETLLISPVSRRQIVLGKFLSLSLICLISSLSSLIAIIVPAYIKLPVTEVLFKDGSGVSFLAFLAIMAVLLPTVVFFAGALIAISSFAKNTREAQTHLNLASFAVMLPAVFSQFIGFTDYATARWVSFIPVLNTATTIRSALLGKLDAMSFLITVSVGLVLAVAGVIVATHLFNREQVLTRV